MLLVHRALSQIRISRPGEEHLRLLESNTNSAQCLLHLWLCLLLWLEALDIHRGVLHRLQCKANYLSEFILQSISTWTHSADSEGLFLCTRDWNLQGCNGLGKFFVIISNSSVWTGDLSQNASVVWCLYVLYEWYFYIMLFNRYYVFNSYSQFLLMLSDFFFNQWAQKVLFSVNSHLKKMVFSFLSTQQIKANSVEIDEDGSSGESSFRSPINVDEILAHVRLPLISLEELLTTVRTSGIISPDKILDAIQLQTLDKVQQRGEYCNII